MSSELKVLSSAPISVKISGFSKEFIEKLLPIG